MCLVGKTRRVNLISGSINKDCVPDCWEDSEAKGEDSLVSRGVGNGERGVCARGPLPSHVAVPVLPTAEQPGAILATLWVPL